MTNFEKCKEEFLIEDVGDGGFCEAIHRIRHEKSCHNRYCKECSEWLKKEYKVPILDKAEKEYFAAFIKPFRDKVRYIAKYPTKGEEYIFIAMNGDSDIWLPRFEEGTRYKNMKLTKLYNLEELGL